MWHQCLCCKESLLLIPSAAASLLIRTLSAISANHWLLKSICPSVTPVSLRPGQGQAQVPGRPTLLQFKKASEFFFPRPQSALRMVAWLSTQSWSSFRMRSAQISRGQTGLTVPSVSCWLSSWSLWFCDQFSSGLHLQSSHRILARRFLGPCWVSSSGKDLCFDL